MSTSTSWAHVQAPEDAHLTEKTTSVFLAGAIAMGDAPLWQPDAANRLSHLPVTVCNPRRDLNWGSDMSKFKEQVDWETKYLKESTVIMMWLPQVVVNGVPNVLPISLLELGENGPKGKVILGRNPNYPRLANVDHFCERHNVPVFDNFDALVNAVKERLVAEIEKKAKV